MENIEVAVRLRPLNQREHEQFDEAAWWIESNQKTILLSQPKPANAPELMSKSPMAKKIPTTHLMGQAVVNQAQNRQKPTDCRDITPTRQSLNGKLSKAINQQQPVTKMNDKSPRHQAGLNLIQQHSKNFQLNGSLSSSQSLQTLDSKKRHCYNFDLCFREGDENQQIYQSMVKRIALSSLNGINGTIFVYGQTGSGKTYTMLGRERKEIMQTPAQTAAKEAKPHSKKKQNQNAIQEQAVSKMHDITFDPSQMDIEEDFLTGKSQEHQNPSEQPGILIFALQDIFKEIQEDHDKTYFLRCSYVEIYNEQIFDLLRSEETIHDTLQLNENKDKDFYIRGVIEEPVCSIDEILYFLRRGELNRHYAETKLNHSSSRSHTIFRLQVQSITNNFMTNQDGTTFDINQPSPQKTKDLKKYITNSVLNFVDLAGSEKVSSHYENKDQDEMNIYDYGDQFQKNDDQVKNRIKEGKHINKSLFFLTQVISMRAEGKGGSSPMIARASLSPNSNATAANTSQVNTSQQFDFKSHQHIPYRNSPLTKILRSSLGGNSRTCVIVCVTPTVRYIEQTISALRFGQNAMKIENKVSANIISNNNEEAVKLLIADYERKIRALEKSRRDQNLKRECQLKVIQSLIEDKQRLTQRILNLGCKKFKALSEKTNLHLIQQQFCGESEYPQSLLMEGVGALELSRAQHSQYRESNTQVLPQDRNQQSCQNFFQDCQIRVQQEQLKQQQLRIHECVEQQQKLEDEIDHIKHYNYQLEEQLLRASQILDQKKTALEDTEEFLLLKSKERFYEQFDKSYAKQLNVEQLTQLEKRMASYLEIVKQERTKRHYQTKIDLVQQQLKTLQRQSDLKDNKQQYQALETVLYLLQSSETHSRASSVSIKNQDCIDIKDIDQHIGNITEECVEFIVKRNNEIKVLQDTQQNIREAINQYSVGKACEFSTFQQKKPQQQPSDDSNDSSESNTRVNRMSKRRRFRGIEEPDSLMQFAFITNKKFRSTSYQQQKDSKSDKSSVTNFEVDVSRQSSSLSPRKMKDKYLQACSQVLMPYKEESSYNQDFEASECQSNRKQHQQLKTTFRYQESNIQESKVLSSNAATIRQYLNANSIQLRNPSMHECQYPQEINISQTENTITLINQDESQQYIAETSVNQALDQEEYSVAIDESLREKGQESFALTHRESNQDLHSNNLFETLQDNMESYEHDQHIIIDHNEYVSFKQNPLQKQYPQEQIIYQNNQDESVSVNQNDTSIQSNKFAGISNSGSLGVLSLNFNKINTSKQQLNQSQGLRPRLEVLTSSDEKHHHFELSKQAFSQQSTENLRSTGERIQSSKGQDSERLQNASPRPERLSFAPVLQEKQSNNSRNSVNENKKAGSRTMKANLDVKNYQPLLSQRRGASNVQQQFKPHKQNQA